MFTKEHFSLPSLEEVRSFVGDGSFGTLATHLEDKVFSSPLPFDLREDSEGQLFVAGHIARANDMLAALVDGNAATLMVLGPDIFVPAEWFGVRTRIPTWLYCAVEISGRLRPSSYDIMVEDVNVMISRLQQKSVPDSTWTLNEISPEKSQLYLSHIFGFRIYDLQIKSCYRLNQGLGNSPALIEHLRASDSDAAHRIAELVASPPTIRPHNFQL